QIRFRYESLKKKNKLLLEKIKDFKNLYYFSKKEYARVMDQVLFSEHLKPLSILERRKAIDHYGLDTRLGYISMVTDFLPYVLKARRDLELDIFRPKIEEKIKDRIKDRTKSRPKSIIKDSEGRRISKRKKRSEVRP
ncbi:hypothetical protein HYU21_04760, partial [Candidatus Woesearchaeota archaeon]|nr:hypothetical protein [Candidatus Woesearchaeota archaeon]